MCRAKLRYEVVVAQGVVRTRGWRIHKLLKIRVKSFVGKFDETTITKGETFDPTHHAFNVLGRELVRGSGDVAPLGMRRDGSCSRLCSSNFCLAQFSLLSPRYVKTDMITWSLSLAPTSRCCS